MRENRTDSLVIRAKGRKEVCGFVFGSLLRKTKKYDLFMFGRRVEKKRND